MYRTMLLTFMMMAIVTCNVAVWRRQRTLDGYVHSDNSNSRTVTSLSECAIECTETSNCISFFYSTNDSACRMLPFTVVSQYGLGINQNSLYFKKETGCSDEFTYESTIGVCFKLNLTRMNHEDALNTCISYKGRLLVVDSDEKQTFFENLLQTPDYIGGPYCIDGSDAVVEDTWLYSDGTPVTYTKFGPDQPSTNKDREDCLTLAQQFNYKMNDVSCKAECRPICEIVL